MAPEAGVTQAEEARTPVVTRFADAGEGLVRDLLALPLRMLAGGLDIFEALLRSAADSISERDPADERVVDLERRMDSLEEQVAGGREAPDVSSSDTTTSPPG